MENVTCFQGEWKDMAWTIIRAGAFAARFVFRFAARWMGSLAAIARNADARRGFIMPPPNVRLGISLWRMRTLCAGTAPAKLPHADFAATAVRLCSGRPMGGSAYQSWQAPSTIRADCRRVTTSTAPTRPIFTRSAAMHRVIRAITSARQDNVVLDTQNSPASTLLRPDAHAKSGT